MARPAAPGPPVSAAAAERSAEARCEMTLCVVVAAELRVKYGAAAAHHCRVRQFVRRGGSRLCRSRKRWPT